jgi:hypothetical protein
MKRPECGFQQLGQMVLFQISGGPRCLKDPEAIARFRAPGNDPFSNRKPDCIVLRAVARCSPPLLTASAIKIPRSMQASIAIGLERSRSISYWVQFFS